MWLLLYTPSRAYTASYSFPSKSKLSVSRSCCMCVAEEVPVSGVAPSHRTNRKNICSGVRPYLTASRLTSALLGM